MRRPFVSARLLICILCCLFLVVTLPAGAQSEQDTREKFQFHGFLTQAYATTDFTDLGPVPNEVILGINEDGTSNYRFLALQFRYEISDKDIVVVQLSSRSLGDSPINAVEDDIELDWAFYERRLTDDTSIKVGRIQIPLGIFNEIRDVGTLLPFYRPPFTFYNEGSFTSETVDGVLLSHTFGSESSWPLDLDVYYGEWELVEQAVLVPEDIPAVARAEDSYGLQLWLTTPVSGLRFGAGAQFREVTEGQEGIFRPVGGSTDFDDWYLSAELFMDKFVVRAEYRENEATLVSPLFGFTSTNKNTLSYVQVGYFFTEKLHLYLQSEESVIAQSSPAFTRPDEFDDRQDIGIALNYRFNSNVVLKAEYHEVDEEIATFVPVFFPDGRVLLDPLSLPSDNGSYSILALAVSF